MRFVPFSPSGDDRTLGKRLKYLEINDLTQRPRRWFVPLEKKTMKKKPQLQGLLSRNAGMFEKVTRGYILTAALSLCILFSALRFAPAQPDPRRPSVLIPPMRIGAEGRVYRNPSIAAAENGEVILVAEVGRGDHRRLAAATLGAIGWTDPVPLGFTGSGDCCNPAVAFDSSGTLHLVWSEKRGETYAIRYARRTPAGRWIDGGVLSRTPRLNCEFPQVAADRNGEIWIAWQAGRATRYGIYLARGDGLSSFSVLNMTGGNVTHHNLYPQLFPDSPYPLVWYEEVETDFRLRAAVPDPSTGRFSVVSPLDLDLLDTNQMPWLFQAPSGMLGAVWTDLVANRVRVLIGFQDPSSRGEGLVADTTDSGEAVQPCAAAVGDRTVALAWAGRRSEGSAVYVGRVDGISSVGQSLALYVSPEGAFARPQLAVARGRVVHCVWFSDAARGGDGGIYYAALRF